MNKFLFLIMLCVQVYGSGQKMDYYTDGIYDTCAMIENSLKAGLREEEIEVFHEKWLVTQDVTDDSTVKIIFYKTIAHKNNFFESVIAKKLSNSKNYIIYGSYSRKADATYAAERLLEKGIAGEVSYSLEKAEYVTNPIIVKKMIFDMKKLLEDTPVLVIKETEILSESSSADDTVLECKPEIVYRDKEKFIDRTKEDFDALEQEWKTRGAINIDGNFVTFKERSGIVNKFKVSDFFKSFKISDISVSSENSKYAMMKIIGQDGKTYQITEKIEPTKKTTKEKIVGKPKAVVESKAVPLPSRDDEGVTYSCDFSKISVVDVKNKGKTPTTQTHYGTQSLIVRANIENEMLKISHPGYETIYINSHYAKNCVKK